MAKLKPITSKAPLAPKDQLIADAIIGSRGSIHGPFTSYITVKGQIVIPSKIRRKFGIKEGTRVQVEVDEQAHQIILTPVTREYIQNLRGKYKGKGLLAAPAAEKKREKKL